jgi:hypothetical protein
MSSEHVFKTIVYYSKLPNTPEKAEIDRQYLNDEIGRFELYQKAVAYIESLGLTPPTD